MAGSVGWWGERIPYHAKLLEWFYKMVYIKHMVEANLVSGSHGFIGSHLVDSLIARGEQVESIDRQLKYPDVKPKVVYHLAAYGNLSDQTNEEMTYQVNLVNTHKLLARLNPKLFVFMSSSSVYGSQSDALSERSPLLGRTDYAMSKIGAEKLVASYYDTKNVAIIRPFSITGVGDQPQHLIPTVIRCAMENQTLTLDPQPKHDFLSVDDLIAGIKLVTDKRLKLNQGISIYNIGSGIQYSNAEVVDMVEDITGKKIKKHLVSGMRPYDSKSWVADITQIKQIGFKVTKSLPQTIEEMVKDYEQRNI